jgi:hypothetical protein
MQLTFLTLFQENNEKLELGESIFNVAELN